jgi:hypothetical protein
MIAELAAANATLVAVIKLAEEVIKLELKIKELQSNA